MNSRPLVSINILIYNSRKKIERCLDSLLAQSYPNFEILLVINGNDDKCLELVRSKYSRFKKIRILEPGENLWFSRGHNFALKYSQGGYVLVLNDDTIMERDFIKFMVAALDEDSSLGSVSGKLLHYNYSIDSKTRILDSTGIEIFKTRRVIDRGQWEEDKYQYDSDTEIFGASGAACLYRKSALEAVKLPKRNGKFEYFDEDFTAYKEDIDLAWRLQLAGYKCRYVPRAVLYHGRTVGRSWPSQFIRFILNRHRQSRLVRQLAFKNHYLMMVKCELPQLFKRHILYIFIRESLLLVYTILFEPFQIAALRKFFDQLPDAKLKRKLVMANVKADLTELRKLFH